MEFFVGILAIVSIFIGMPWIIFHYITQWKKTGSVTVEDEQLMDQLYETARRLEDRLQTIERIIAADHPEFRQLSSQRERDPEVRLDKDPRREPDHIRQPRDEDYRRERY